VPTTGKDFQKGERVSGQVPIRKKRGETEEGKQEGPEEKAKVSKKKRKPRKPSGQITPKVGGGKLGQARGAMGLVSYWKKGT